MRMCSLVLALAACTPADPQDDDTDLDTDVDTEPVDTDTDGADTDETDETDDTVPVEPDPMTVTITPATPLAGDALTCVPGEAGPALFRWEVNGVEANIQSAEVPADLADAYETWTCFAATADGAFAGSASVEIDETCTSYEGTGGDGLLAVNPNGPLDRTGRDFTIELWAQWPAAPEADADLVVHAGLLRSTPASTDYALRLTGDGKLLFLTGGEVDGCADLVVDAPAAGTWHHIAGSWVASTGAKRLYVNGQLVGSCTTEDRPRSALGSFYVGGSLDTVGDAPAFVRGFTGHIDEVRLSNKERYPFAFGPALYHPVDSDTIVLLHLNAVGTFGTSADPWEGTPDTSLNGFHARFGTGVTELSDAASTCDLR